MPIKIISSDIIIVVTCCHYDALFLKGKEKGKTVRLTSPSIWICFTEVGKTPPLEAIAALGTGPDSLVEAIDKRSREQSEKF